MPVPLVTPGKSNCNGLLACGDLDFTCKSFPDIRSVLSIIFIILPDVNLADVSDMTLPCSNEGDLTSTMTPFLAPLASILIIWLEAFKLLDEDKMSIIFADVILSPRIRIICPLWTELDVSSNAPFVRPDDLVCMSSIFPVVNDDVFICVSFNNVPSAI